MFHHLLFLPTPSESSSSRSLQYTLSFTLPNSPSKKPSMHAVMRRMPVERAHHAKRLGHVQGGSGPVLPILVDNASVTTTQQGAPATTSASSQTVPTSPSSTQSSSSAPPPSSATQSSSFVSSSASTSSTSSSVTSSASTQSSTPTASSPSLITQPTVLTPTYPTSSSTPTSTPQTQAAAVTNSGLSGGAIAGIIAGAVIVGVALIVFFVRKTYLRRRERKRISWDATPGLGAGVLDEPKFPGISERSASFTDALNTPQRGAPLSPFEPHEQTMYSTPVPPAVRMQPPTISSYAVPSPPLATYNNPSPVAAYPAQPVPSTYNLGNTAFAVGRAATGMSSTLPSVRAQHAPMEALVKCTFVPTLPDELSITTGERVFIVEQYDDGWDLCANGRGERGMVPRECLERAPSDQPGIGWRNVRRMSSLNPDGRRF